MGFTGEATEFKKKTQLNLPENKIFQNAYSLSLLKPIKKDVGPIPHMCRVYYSF